MEENSRVNNDESKVVKEKQQNFLKYSKTSLFKSDFAKKSEYLELKRSINKLLLDEETVQKIEDARETKFYFEKLRQLELCRLTLMVMAQAVAILDVKQANQKEQLQYEIEFHDQNGYYAQWFLYIILICSIILSKFLLVINFLRVETIGKKLIIITELNFLTINYYIIQIVIMTYFSYQAQNQFIIATKQYGKEISIFNTEMGIYLIFPQPWFQKIKVYFFVDFYQIRVYHYLNEILLLIMLLRFIIMAKIILMNTQWYNERVNRIWKLNTSIIKINSPPLYILEKKLIIGGL